MIDNTIISVDEAVEGANWYCCFKCKHGGLEGCKVDPQVDAAIFLDNGFLRCGLWEAKNAN